MLSRLLICTIAIVSLPSVALAGTFTGRAVDLQANNVPNVTVTVLNAQGVPIVSAFSPDGNYFIEVDNAQIAAFNFVVTLLFTAPGRDDVTLTQIFGATNQTIDVVMPDEKPRLAVNHCYYQSRCVRTRWGMCRGFLRRWRR